MHVFTRYFRRFVMPASFLLLIQCESREVISDIQVVIEPDKGMILIPEGEFTMGYEGSGAETDEQPVHTVYLDAYYISQNPVTNEQYLEYWKAADGGQSSHHTPIQAGSLPWPDIVTRLPNHPVVGVSWLDAKAYAEWMGVRTEKSYRLPTEAEWEKAARGTEGRMYPWGNQPPDLNSVYRANFWQDENTPDGFYRTSPVSFYNGINLHTGDGRSPYGIHDMSGNVWEWVEDWYGISYYNFSPAKNPPGQSSNHRGEKVLRGGSYQDSPEIIRATNRAFEHYGSKLDFVGFRIVLETTPVD